MNKNSKRVLAAVAASTLILGSLAITSAQAAVKSVTLVYQGPLTGSDAQTGQDEFLGAQTAVQIYNDSKPAVTVKLITADDQGEGAIAGTIAPGLPALP